jgi:hypothetical protein
MPIYISVLEEEEAHVVGKGNENITKIQQEAE